jgi:hypothetical protein
VITRWPSYEGERRAFEVHDFTVNTERTSVLIIGRAYDPLPGGVHPDR